jgi:hypothetical protein
MKENDMVEKFNTFDTHTHKDENIINESLSEFGFQQFGLSGLNTAAVEPKDPTLSLDAWDKHKNNLRDQFARLQGILQNVFSTYSGSYIKSVNLNIEELTNLYIHRIYKNNVLGIDIQIKFEYENENYYGVFKNYTSSEVDFRSNILSIPIIALHPENKIKIVGILKKCLNEWFKPYEGLYKTLKDVKVYNDMGDIFYIEKGSVVIVDEVLRENNKPIIYLLFRDKRYYLCDIDYYFFNYWFSKKEKTNFYI